MNPLTNVKNTQKLNERELELGVVGTSASWHKDFKDSAWIFVGGLPYDLTEGDIICVFSQYGEIVNLNLVRDKQSGKSRGFCFICYEDQRSTILAVDNLNAIKLLNRTLRVQHVEDYKMPKEHGDEDDLTMKLRREGCAPQVAAASDSSGPKMALQDKKDKKKKEKKKKKKKKKKRQAYSSDSEDSETSESSPEQDKGSHKFEGKSEQPDHEYSTGRSSGEIQSKDRVSSYSSRENHTKDRKFKTEASESKKQRDLEKYSERSSKHENHTDRKSSRDREYSAYKEQEYDQERRDHRSGKVKEKSREMSWSRERDGRGQERERYRSRSRERYMYTDEKHRVRESHRSRSRERYRDGRGSVRERHRYRQSDR